MSNICEIFSFTALLTAKNILYGFNLFFIIIQNLPREMPPSFKALLNYILGNYERKRYLTQRDSSSVAANKE
jgi:hypothetical protein